MERGINEECSIRRVTRDDMCDYKSSENKLGEYKILSLRDYLDYQSRSTKEYETIDGNTYVIFMRSDSVPAFTIKDGVREPVEIDVQMCTQKQKQNINLFKQAIPYRDRMKRYFAAKGNNLNPDHRLVSFSEYPGEDILAYNTGGKKWGNEPGIGINLTLTVDGARSYLNEARYYVLRRFYINVKLLDYLRVLLINEQCQWTQITCDERNALLFDFIGHLGDNNEINLLVDTGLKYVDKIKSSKENVFTKPGSTTLFHTSNYREYDIKYNDYEYNDLPENYKEYIMYEVDDTNDKIEVNKKATTLTTDMITEFNNPNPGEISELIKRNKSFITDELRSMARPRTSELVTRVPASASAAASLSVDEAEKKYLKYKQKYLQLKQSLKK